MLLQLAAGDCLPRGIRQDFHTDSGTKRYIKWIPELRCQGGLCACSGDRKYHSQLLAILPIPHPGLFGMCSPFRIPSGELSGGDLCLWGVLGGGVSILFYVFAISVEALMLEMSHLVGNWVSEELKYSQTNKKPLYLHSEIIETSSNQCLYCPQNLESYSWVILIHHVVLHVCHCVFITYWSVLHLRVYYSVQSTSTSLKFWALDKLLFKLKEAELTWWFISLGR